MVHAGLHESKLAVANPDEGEMTVIKFHQQPFVDPAPHLAARHYCGKGAIVLTMADSNVVVIVPTRCKHWACPTCGPILARYWSERISKAMPERFITLTADRARWPTPEAAYTAMKKALPKLVRYLRSRGIEFEYVAVWELHESGWPHLHLCQKGSFVPQKLLSRAWDFLDIGPIVDIRTVVTKRGVAAYVAKYMAKSMAKTAATFRITKIVQCSRRFFPKVLLPEKREADVRVKAVHTRLHAAQVVCTLFRAFGYVLDPENETKCLRLIPGTQDGPTVSQVDIIRALS